MAAKKSKRGTSLEPDGEPPVKKLRSADEEERRATLMSPGLSKLGNMNGLRGARSGEKPAELFRKDLISAMKLPDTEPLQPDDYFLIQDQWRQEWEKGVQVPVNPDNIPVVSAHFMVAKENVSGPHPFKIPKKLLHSAKDEAFQSVVHELHEQHKLAEQVCRYDLDDLDVHWLESFNDLLEEWGEEPIEEDSMERIVEEIETQCHEEMQVKIKTVEGLGIEYDENVVCDVCRSPDSEDGNEMVFCDNCDICVHQACYGVQTIPEGSWLCRPCALGIRPQCILCPKTGGAMKSTKSGSKWAHVSCALWIPEVSIGCAEKMEPITKISHIPSSRWSLCCSICRERSGACIQCSVKTCKTALHVTCAFQNNLEMKTILEDDNAEIQLKAYCQKHTRKIRNEGGLSPRKSESGSPINSPKKPEDMTEEEKTELRSHRLKKLEEEFYTCVEPEKIAKALDLSVTVADYIYSYWILKRKSNFNKPLLTPKQEEEDLLLKQQEDSLLARMKMFVHLRQDLERVRNLCYMVNKREKMSRSLHNMKETIFWKQVAVLEAEPIKNNETRDATFIATAHRSTEMYDSYDDIMRMARMLDPEIPYEPIVHDLEHIKARPGRPRKESALLGLEEKAGMVDDDEDDKPDLSDSQLTDVPEQKLENLEMKEAEKPDLTESGRRLKKVGRPPKGVAKRFGLLLPPKELRRRNSAVSDGEKPVVKELKDSDTSSEMTEEKEVDICGDSETESAQRQVLMEVTEPSNQTETENNLELRKTRNVVLEDSLVVKDVQKSVKEDDVSVSDGDNSDLSIRSLRRRTLQECSDAPAPDSKPVENEILESPTVGSPIHESEKPVRRRRPVESEVKEPPVVHESEKPVRRRRPTENEVKESPVAGSHVHESEKPVKRRKPVENDFKESPVVGSPVYESEKSVRRRRPVENEVMETPVIGSPVHESEKPVKRRKPVENEVKESPVIGSTVNESEKPVRRRRPVESEVKEPPAVQESEMPVRRRRPVENEVKELPVISSPVHESEKSVKRRKPVESAVQESLVVGLPVHEPEKTVRRRRPAENEAKESPVVGSPVHESEKPVRRRRPVENEVQEPPVVASPVHESEKPVRRRKPVENEVKESPSVGSTGHESEKPVKRRRPVENEESHVGLPVHESEKPVRRRRPIENEVREPPLVGSPVHDSEKPVRRHKVGRRSSVQKSPEPVHEANSVKEAVKEQVGLSQPRRSLRSASEVKLDEELDVINVEEKPTENVESAASPPPPVKSREKEWHKRTLFKEEDEKPHMEDIKQSPPPRVLRSRLSPEAKEFAPAAPECSVTQGSPPAQGPVDVNTETLEELEVKPVLPVCEDIMSLPELELETNYKVPLPRRTRASDKRLDSVDSEDKHSPKSADVAPQLSDSASDATPANRDSVPPAEENFAMPPAELNGDERHLRSRHSLPKENGRLSKRRKRGSNRSVSGKFLSSQLMVGASMKQKVQDRLLRMNRPQSPIKNLQHYAQRRITSFFSKGDSSNLSQQAISPRSKDRHASWCGNATQSRQDNGRRQSINEAAHSPRCGRSSASSSHRITPLKYTSDAAKLGSPETRSMRRKADSDLDSDVSNHVFDSVDGGVSIRSSRSTTPEYGMRGTRRELDFSHSIHNLGRKVRGRRGKYSVTPSELSEDSLETVLDSEDDVLDTVSETSSYSLRRTRSRTLEPADSNDSESSNGRHSSHQPIERLRTRHIGSPRHLGSPRS